MTCGSMELDLKTNKPVPKIECEDIDIIFRTISNGNPYYRLQMWLTDGLLKGGGVIPIQFEQTNIG